MLYKSSMRKATFAKLESGSKWFIAIGVRRSKSLLELYIGCGRHVTGEIRRTAADVHLMHQYTQFICDTMSDRQPV